MIKSFKTELNPTQEQATKIRQTIGVCRFLYNHYIYINKQIYEAMKHLGLSHLKSFISGYDFDKWVNNVLSKREGYEWIKDVSSKARKQAIMNAETAYKCFFKKQSGFPRFKKRNHQDVKAYFPKNNQGDLIVERHRIKVTTLGFVRLKEKGYIPTNAVVKSATVSMKAGRYYISVLCEVMSKKILCEQGNTEGVGVDLGIKEFAVISDGRRFRNINKTKKVKRIKRKLRRQQRRLSRKYQMKLKSKKKGECTKNIEKQVLRVQKLHNRLLNIRNDYIYKTVDFLVKTKPEYIVIEDLNVRGMMKNRHLSRAIGEQCFSRFKEILTSKCQEHGIQLRRVNRFFPSSKMCNCCGNIKRNLKLSNRIYICDKCKYKIDRDLGAAINLAMAEEYTIIT
ncbi:MAG: transposase [Candidatus Paceibacterota bacterium]